MGTLRIKPMDGPFGAIVDGISLAQTADGAIISQLMAALYRHRILVIPEQYLSEESYLAFGRGWGDPILFFSPNLRDGSYPELIVIHNHADTPEIMRNVALHWHVDGSYEDPPASTTMLNAVEAPLIGNETKFCDMVAAYDALDPQMKARIEDLVVVHGIGDPRLMNEDETRGYGDKAAAEKPVVYHPLVMRHPVTGERAIYAPSGSARGIVGMADEEAIELLRTVKRHATQPRFVQTAAAQTGGLLIWDNYAVMHSATPTRYSDAVGERRLIHRISTRDIPSLT